MIEFVKINLLPYREEIKQRKKQQFKVLMLSALLIGAGLLVLTYLTINNAISRQEDRNALLGKEIEKLDKALGEILKLQQEKENFLSNTCLLCQMAFGEQNVQEELSSTITLQ